MQRRITLDFETRSLCDLKKAGAFKYSLDPSTRPTCLAFKERDKPVSLFTFEKINLNWQEHSVSFRNYWRSLIGTDTLFIAHNAFFEQVIYEHILVRRYGWPIIPLHQWRCTAAKAAACALPRSLEGAGAALNLTTQKDKGGYIAMMATCKPTKQWNTWKKNFDKGKADDIEDQPPVFLEPHVAPGVFEDLYKYCKIDVVTEELLDIALPDLIPQEQNVWFLNQKINWRGIRVDIPTVKKIVDIMTLESKTKLKELDTLTMGLVTKAGARQSILDFLALEGIELPDIRAKTVDEILKEGKLSPDMERLLEIRKALSKTSTKKYQALIDRAGTDNRVRDILLYHGASTGRDSGKGIQPQNFPRGAISVNQARPYAAVENVIKCDRETLKLLYGDNLSILFSSILRNMILPSENCMLYVADFSKIEVAVLWWLADNKPGLKILHEGKDPYKYMAAANKNCSYEGISDDSDDRQLGKAQVLGCGFGMGRDKFKTTAWDMHRLKLTDAQSKAAVDSYRKANAAVPELWREYEQTAICAIEKPGTVFNAGKCKFVFKRSFLWITLPSGRSLAYKSPRLGFKETDYGPQPTIEFMGLAPNKKEMRMERTWGGTLTENIVQAVARDLMAESSLRLEQKNYRILLTVHDEIITEHERGDLKKFKSIMCERPSWADKTLPLDAKAWSGPRYKK